MGCVHCSVATMDINWRALISLGVTLDNGTSAHQTAFKVVKQSDKKQSNLQMCICSILSVSGISAKRKGVAGGTYGNVRLQAICETGGEQ